MEEATPPVPTSMEATDQGSHGSRNLEQRYLLTQHNIEPTVTNIEPTSVPTEQTSADVSGSPYNTVVDQG